MKQITLFLTALLFNTFICWSQSIQHPTLEQLKILETDINSGQAGQLNTHDSDLDSAGNLIIIGTFNAVIDMDPSSGTHILSANPSPPSGQNTLYNMSSYIAKYTPSGDLIWAYKLGDDSNIVMALYVKVDTSDNINIIGSYKYSADFDLWNGQHILNSPNSFKTFAVSYTPNGELNWVNDIDLGNSASGAEPRDVEFKTSGRIVVAGNFYGQIIFPTSLGQIILTNSGQSNCFFAELDTTGNWVFARHVSNPHKYSIESIATDSNNNVICNIRESEAGSPLLYSLTIRRYFNSGFIDYEDIIKLVPQDFNTALSFGKMDIDYNDNIYFGGVFRIPTYVNGSLFLKPSSTTSYDAYLVKIDSYNNVVWKKTLTPTPTPNQAYVSYLTINNLKVDESNRLMLTGSIKGEYNIGNNTTFSSDLDPSRNNAHVMQFNQSGDPVWAYVFQGSSLFISAIPASLHLLNDEFYVYGKLKSLTDFDLHPVGNTNTDVDNNDPDIFMAKYHDININKSIESSILVEPFKVYPTVITDYAFIYKSLRIEGNHLIELYDLSGTLKMQMEMLGNETNKELYIANLKTGVYVLKIKNVNGGYVQTVKLIKK